MSSDPVVSAIAQRFMNNNISQAQKFVELIRSRKFNELDVSQTNLQFYNKNSIFQDVSGPLEIPVQTHTVDASYRYASLVLQDITSEKLEKIESQMLPAEMVQFAMIGSVQSDVMVSSAPYIVNMEGGKGDDVMFAVTAQNHVTMNGR